MADPESRESRVLVPNFRRTEPIAPTVPARLAVAPAPALAPTKVFIADQPNGADALGIETPISIVAELAAHKNTELPLCIGILGGAGSGKSFALTRLAASVAALTPSARATQAETPYLAGIEIIRADAAQLDGDAATALTSALSAHLHRSAPQLVEEAWRTVRDPHAAVQEAAQSLDQAQHKLHQERDKLNEVEGRRARLFETLLYDTPGSQVDAYARAHRPRIAGRLQVFGFSGDPILNYKDLVASLGAAQGPGSRLAMSLRSIWAFKGQTRLLVYALLLVLLGLGLEWAVAHQALWLAPLGNANAAFASPAVWIEAHLYAAETIAKIAFAAAILAIAANLWRAWRFLHPVWRGVTLLKAEFANKRHDLETAAAHQTRRVDGLAAEVERHARAHAEAEKQAGGATSNARSAAPYQNAGDKSRAPDFVAALSALIVQGQGTAPRRVLVMLDNLDAVSIPRAGEILDCAHRLLAHQGFVTVAALDPRRLAEASDGTQARLEKWIQVPLRVDAHSWDQAGFVSHLIGYGGVRPSEGTPAKREKSGSGLDHPLSAGEGELLALLAPLAGSSARKLKRFVNLYRLARPLLPEHWASLAFLLALNAGGSDAEIVAMSQALAIAKPGGDLAIPHEHAQIAELVSAVSQFEAAPIADALKRAAPIAAYFSF